MADVFGPIIGPWNVEAAVLETLKTWLPACLYDIELKNGLQQKALGRPPSVSAYRGGLDWLSVKEEWLPAVVAVANPVGEPERLPSTIIQPFEVEVGCVVFSEEGTDPEGAARMRAGFFAAATMAAIVPRGALEGFAAQESVLVGAPRVEFFDDEQRKVAVGITTWHVYAAILDPNAGPVTIKEVNPEGPYPSDPESKTHHTTVIGEPIEVPL